uniref:Uncharacterized protein n=1 Tax=Wuchereria bancrofti TaxID=6293 RepID=A0A1I8EFC5_WUCBA
MFGHLHENDEMIEIAIETGLSTQNDSWSCGLRAKKSENSLCKIIQMDRPSRKVIANEQFGQFNLITEQSSSETLSIGRKEINIRRNREEKLSKFIIDKNSDVSSSDNDSSDRKSEYLWMCKSNKSRRMSSSKHNSPENFKSNKEILSTVSVLGAGSKRVS